ncbi:MAG: hypothetical protein TE42_05950 [Candidatus Synechococcus spongiarum SP3]|uniref:Ycf66 family protein n=1 Tax=Candidatus Synechococcus spongiarum SP3 TaxID=1604020 RepID=A0A0G2HKU7_9SYNE|nr:MAG: hypothetical protein TE42_05950 [Candidatus Synechococcus spongiarum SP3]
MVNTSLNWVSIVGIVLMLGGALLFSLRTYKPALSRDTDVFFAAVGLLCGGILFFQGWRLDPILQFSQFLLATTTVFFVYESVRLRGVTAEQARRSEFMDDPEGDEPRPRVAPVGSGLDEWDTLEQRPSMRRRALAAADWDQTSSRRPIRRSPEEEQPRWSDAPPLPARQTSARQRWDSDTPQPVGGGRPTRRSRDPMAAPSLRPQRPERATGRGPLPRAQLEPSGERFPSPRPQPRDQRPAVQPQHGGSHRARRGNDRSERPLLARRQRRPVVRPEPFDQDPSLKLARSVPRASLPPQGRPLHRNQNTAPVPEPESRPEDERDNSGRFDD